MQCIAWVCRRQLSYVYEIAGTVNVLVCKEVMDVIVFCVVGVLLLGNHDLLLRQWPAK